MLHSSDGVSLSVLELLNNHDFSISAEIIPPRNGTDFAEVFDQIRQLHKAQFNFISVTHGAGGSLRGGTLPITHFAQSHQGLTAIAHLTCRGATKEDLENQLIDHHYFGIRNILALRGDSPDGLNTDFKAVPGGHSYAWQLVQQMTALNRGEYIVRDHFDKAGAYREGMPTAFCIGVACYPEDPHERRLLYLQKKKEVGAHFAISQMVFDFDIFESFYSQVVAAWGQSFPVIPGIRIPSNLKQLERMQDKFQIKVPKALMQAMQKAENKSSLAMQQVGQSWAVDFISASRKIGVRGIHFFIMGNPNPAIEVKQKLQEIA